MWVQPATSAHIALSSFKFSFSRFCVIGQKTGYRGDRTAEGQGTCLSQPQGSPGQAGPLEMFYTEARGRATQHRTLTTSGADSF